MPDAARQISMPIGIHGQESGDAVFARGLSDPLGKLDDAITDLRIDSETKAILSLQANRAGKPLVEWCRFVLQCQAHGVEYVRSLHLRRFDAVRDLSGIGRE